MMKEMIEEEDSFEISLPEINAEITSKPVASLKLQKRSRASHKAEANE